MSIRNFTETKIILPVVINTSLLDHICRHQSLKKMRTIEKNVKIFCAQQHKQKVQKQSALRARHIAQRLSACFMLSAMLLGGKGGNK